MIHKFFVYFALILKHTSPPPLPKQKTTHILVRVKQVIISRTELRQKCNVSACFQRAHSKFLELTMNAVFNLAPRFLFFPFSLGNGRKRNPENEEGLLVDTASVPFVNARCHFY